MDTWTTQQLGVLAALRQSSSTQDLQSAVGTKSRRGLYVVLRALADASLITEPSSKAKLTAAGLAALEAGTAAPKPARAPRARYRKDGARVVVTVGSCTIACRNPGEVPEALDHARRWADRRTAVTP